MVCICVWVCRVPVALGHASGHELRNSSCRVRSILRCIGGWERRCVGECRHSGVRARGYACPLFASMYSPSEAPMVRPLRTAAVGKSCARARDMRLDGKSGVKHVVKRLPRTTWLSSHTPPLSPHHHASIADLSQPRLQYAPANRRNPNADLNPELFGCKKHLYATLHSQTWSSSSHTSIVFSHNHGSIVNLEPTLHPHLRQALRYPLPILCPIGDQLPQRFLQRRKFSVSNASEISCGFTRSCTGQKASSEGVQRDHFLTKVGARWAIITGVIERRSCVCAPEAIQTTIETGGRTNANHVLFPSGLKHTNSLALSASSALVNFFPPSCRAVTAFLPRSRAA